MYKFCHSSHPTAQMWDVDSACPYRGKSRHLRTSLMRLIWILFTEWKKMTLHGAQTPPWTPSCNNQAAQAGKVQSCDLARNCLRSFFMVTQRGCRYLGEQKNMKERTWSSLLDSPPLKTGISFLWDLGLIQRSDMCFQSKLMVIPRRQVYTFWCLRICIDHLSGCF